MISDIITDNGLDLGIATAGNDSIITSQLPSDQIAYFSASPFPDAIALLEGNDNALNDNTARIFYGNQGNDTMTGGGGNDTLFGGRDNDFLEAGGGNSILFGNLGNDNLSGGSGNDSLYGGAGNDVVIGGSGNSIVSGDKGLDTLTGSGGANQFILASSGADRDVITDFQTGIDKMSLPTGLTFADLEVRGSGGNTEILRNGEVVAILNGVISSSINSNDFIAAGQETPPPPPAPNPVEDPLPPNNSTLAEASQLGVLTENGLVLGDFVGDEDTYDYYRFTLPTNGQFIVELGSVTESARVHLIKDFNNNGEINEGDGDLLSTDVADSSNNAEISRAIQAGTYYVRVSPYRSGRNTNYDLGFGFLSQPSTLSLSPGNTLSTALDIGNLTPRQTVEVTDFVGDTDYYDVYQFTVDSNRDVEMTLGAVTDSARVELIKDFNNNGEINEGDDDILSTDVADSSNNAEISRAIQVGTYYVRVSPYRSGRNTNYDLTISVE